MLATVARSIKIAYIVRLQLGLRFEVARANEMPIGWIAPREVVHLAEAIAASGWHLATRMDVDTY